MSGRDWFDRPDRSGEAGPGQAAPGMAGLRFECTQCGNCCTGAPGFVLFKADEAKAMAADLGVTVDQFFERYTHDTPSGRSLNERMTEFGRDCVFLDRETRPGKALCRVYRSRPSQCRTWPFWPENLRSPEAWKRASRGCPGMNRGPLHEPEVIRVTVRGMMAD